MKVLAYLAAGVLLLAGLFLLLRPVSESPPVSLSAQPATLRMALPKSPASFDLVVRDSRLVSGPDVVRISQGDEIILRITADRQDEFHLHGYDLELALEAGKPAELRFRADRSGRFEFELHRSHAALGALEVQPR